MHAHSGSFRAAVVKPRSVYLSLYFYAHWAHPTEKAAKDSAFYSVGAHNRQLSSLPCVAAMCNMFSWGVAVALDSIVLLGKHHKQTLNL